jgi:hypothetical protein
VSGQPAQSASEYAIRSIVDGAGTDEASGLLTVHAFRQMTMQERVVDVHLVDRPIAHSGDGEHSPDGGGLDHRTECFVEVDAGALGEPAHDPARLVALHGAVALQFMPEQPLATDNIGAGRPRHERSGPVRHQSPVLILHSG